MQEAQQRANAEHLLGQARQAEQEALDATDEAVGLMRSNLLAALAAYQEAVRAEAGVLPAQRQAIEARRLMGEWPEHHPGPTAAGSQKCRVLADTNPLVRELAKWRP
jgi:hypothetical protein